MEPTTGHLCLTVPRILRQGASSWRTSALSTTQWKRRSAMSGNLSRRRRGLRDSCFVGKVPSRHRLTRVVPVDHERHGGASRSDIRTFAEVGADRAGCVRLEHDQQRAASYRRGRRTGSAGSVPWPAPRFDVSRRHLWSSTRFDDDSAVHGSGPRVRGHAALVDPVRSEIYRVQ